jgi:hypothetical protein
MRDEAAYGVNGGGFIGLLYLTLLTSQSLVFNYINAYLLTYDVNCWHWFVQS